MKQSDLAEKVGTTTATISRIEAGRQWPAPALLTALERATKGAVTTAAILADYHAATSRGVGKRRHSLTAAE